MIRKIGFTILALIALVSTDAQAFACKDIFRSATRSEHKTSPASLPEFIRLAEEIESLRSKNGSLSFNKVSTLVLNSAERMYLNESFNQMLTGINERYSRIKKDNLLSSIGEWKPVLDQLSRRIRSAKENLIYIDSLRLAKDLSYVAHQLYGIEEVFVRPVLSEQQILKRMEKSWKHDLNFIKSITQRGIAIVPTFESLSIYDFNYLLGTGIAPAGLILASVTADGVLYEPGNFFSHDLSHANRMIKLWNKDTRTKWLRFLDELNKLDETERDLIHLVIFYTTHEGFSSNIEKISNPAELQDYFSSKANFDFFLVKLQKADFFDE